MSKPQSYWEKRKARELYEELVKAEDVAEEMRQLYIASSNEIKEEAVKLARRFQLRHNLSVKEADRLLNKVLSPDNIEHLIQLLKQDPRNAAIAAELESQSYASRINRLGAVQKSIDRVATEIYKQTNSATTTVLQDIGESMYYKQLFEMQQRAGAAFGFTPLDPDRLMSIISRRWSGQNFSERLWANREQLAAEVKKQLLLGILTGRANRKMAQEIDSRFSVSYNNTRRLVRTEANYVANQLQVESYKDTGVDKYIYVAILDLRTSEICQELDKKRFLLANAKVGENYPPMHPWCRSTTIAWMPDQLLKKLEQSAIDPATGETITVPGDMTYREWYDRYGPKSVEVPDEPGPAAETPVTADATETPESLDFFEDYQQEFLDTAYTSWSSLDKEVAREAVTEAFDNGAFYQCMGTTTLEHICETDGLIKNQFETGSSTGLFDPEVREKAARQLFGCDTQNMAAADFEKYGFLNRADPFEAFEHRGYARGYGAVQIQYKKDNLKGRTTYTVGDSLDEVYSARGKGIAGSDGDDPTIAGIRPIKGVPRELFTKIEARSIITSDDLKDAYNARYIELQYHGKLTIDDVDTVIFPYWEPLKPQTVQTLKNRGVRVFVREEVDNEPIFRAL